MAIKIMFNGVEVRKPGYTVKTGQSILAGQPVMLDTADTTGATIMLADGATIVGFALETNVSPITMSYLYDDYNRGGLISAVAGNGGELEVWNDGRGDVYDFTQTYTIRQLVYVGTDGKITNQANGNSIGFVTKAPAGVGTALRIQLTL